MSVSKVLRIATAGVAVAALAVLLVPAFATSAKSATTSEAKGKALSQRSLYNLYAGKSWFWKDGVAYFGRDGRFYAWAGTGSKASFVKGGWGAYGNGKLCFSGTWQSPSGDGFDSSCFSHRVAKGDILQRREPSGDWYTFKHARTKKADEYSKVVPGDYVSTKWRQLAKGGDKVQVRTYASTRKHHH